ncbi:MAG: PDZ domain-containing protein, partial [Spirochaetales bacterium]|nr:PDZ domain-containing protein [Spirochaetales bacterium]
SVVYSVPGSPAEIAGIPQGAVVTALNGQPVKNLEDLQYALIRERPGTIVRVTGIPALTGELEQEYRDWFVMVDKRPERPGSLIFERDIESRALLPIMGLDLERVGNSKKYMVRSVVRGSVADESGFSEQDVVEIRNLDVQHKDGYVALQLYTKRRKSGYLDAFIGLSASLDSPSYF